MTILPNPATDPDPDWYTDLGRNSYRFEPDGPRLRILRKDRTPSDAFVVVEYRKGLEAYVKFDMSDRCRAKLIRWFRDEGEKEF